MIQLFLVHSRGNGLLRTKFALRYTKEQNLILNAVAGDKVKDNDYQDVRDVVTLGIVSDLQHYDSWLKEIDKQLEQMYHARGCTLTIIPRVNIITGVKILAGIGDIHRFSNKDKLAQFAAITPIKLSSSGKGKNKATKQGNRSLQAIIYFRRQLVAFAITDGAGILKGNTKKSSILCVL